MRLSLSVPLRFVFAVFRFRAHISLTDRSAVAHISLSFVRGAGGWTAAYGSSAARCALTLLHHSLFRVCGSVKAFFREEIEAWLRDLCF